MKLLENAVFESLTNNMFLQARDMRIDGRLVKYFTLGKFCRVDA